MKKFNKGMVITSTVAAALAALTFAGCGSTANETVPKNAPASANAVQAVKNEEAAKPAAKTEEKTAEKKAETDAVKNTEKPAEVGTAGSNYYNYGWEAEGTFYEVNGSRMRLEISKSDMGEGLYNCSVICSGSAFDCEVYGFLAHYENDTLIYDCGAKSYTSYDSNGCVAENYIIDEGHSGTITYTGAAGLRWTDSDGSSYVFMSDITLA